MIDNEFSHFLSDYGFFMQSLFYQTNVLQILCEEQLMFNSWWKKNFPAWYQTDFFYFLIISL